VKEDLEAQILEAFRNALCDDYCLVDNCLRCNQARLDAVRPLLFKIPTAMFQQKWLETEALVADGVRHKDALTVLTEVLTQLGTPPKRKPRI
jgi:hypothetical protein